MLGPIIKHEWRNLIAQSTLWPIVGLFALLIGYGVYNGAAWVQFQQEAIQTARQDEATRFASLGKQLESLERGPAAELKEAPQASAWFVGYSLAGRYAVMPPGPLASLSVGQSDLYPYYFKVTSASKQAFINNNEIENPTNLLAGHFDLAFVIIYLYPLLILALSYNLISQERDEGTLSMLLSQPVALGTFVLGKIAFRALIVLALAVVFSLIGVVLSGAELGAPETALRLGLWMLVVASYGAFWFAAAVAVNALGGSSATNAVALTGLWLAFVVLIPALVNITISAVDPMPSRLEMIQSLREASSVASAQSDKFLTKYQADHPELAAEGKGGFNYTDYGVRYTLVQDEVDRRVQPVLERFDAQLLRQQELVDRYRYLSPAVVTQEALNDLAGTGVARYRHFLGQVEAYHRDWQKFFRADTMSKQYFNTNDLQALPRFRFSEEASGPLTERVLGGLLGLIAPTFLLGLVGLSALRRYPITG